MHIKQDATEHWELDFQGALELLSALNSVETVAAVLLQNSTLLARARADQLWCADSGVANQVLAIIDSELASRAISGIL